jgi:signal transduction histidine kinase
MRLWPRSLAGQMALLVALALFVAQAINFGLLLRERQAFLLEQITGPAITRVIDAIERTAQGRGPLADRGRVRRLPDNPISPTMPHKPAIEAALRDGLHDSGVAVGRIVTGVHPMDPRNPPYRGLRGRRAERYARSADEIVIAVEQPGHGWLVLRSPWPRNDWYLVWRLIGQTLILYGIVLLPVLWVGRRISRPLRKLTLAAERFRPGDGGEPVPESGPRDVAQLIAAYNKLRLRVIEMLDEKDRMLGAIGHDLRTPLAALRVRIESVEDDTDRARMAETIAEMNRTLDDILSLARLGRPSEPLIETDLAALVDAVVEDFRDLEADVTFIDADRLPIRLRPSLMRRAIRNLIENAIKYGRCAEVSIAAEATRVAIHVADRGPGIPEHQMASVFDAFTRLETSRNRDTGGIGLGLALARAIVREAGGDIMLVNRAEGGLVATVWLPRVR